MRKLLVSLLFTSACVATATTMPPPPPPGPGPGPAPMAADNGQPKMQAALSALQQAQSEAQAAEANKGGHRERALEQIQIAIDAVNQGIQWAAQHASETGIDDGPAEAEPVDEEVKGGQGQPHMANAIVALREARRQLKEARHDKGGLRRKGLHAINEALKQLREGMHFAEHHG
jgi:hypothetical protein